jgi:hypothetical protein
MCEYDTVRHSYPIPLVDGSVNTHYANTGQIVSLYGSYGVLDERETGSSAGILHYTQGTDLASQIVPLCSDGTQGGSNGCSDGGPKKIVFLFIGFSNCDVEICGGHVDAWDASRANRGPGQLPLPQTGWPGLRYQMPELRESRTGPRV